MSETKPSSFSNALDFFDFNNPKDWAKSRGIDVNSHGMEALKSMFNQESKRMENVLKEEAVKLMANGEIASLVVAVSNSKGPVLKAAAELINDSSHSQLLDALLARFQYADLSGKKAILKASERAATLPHIEKLTSIQATLKSQKKQAKAEAELLREVSIIIDKVVRQDKLLSMLRDELPELCRVADSSIEELNPRLAFLPLNIMLPWLNVILNDDVWKKKLTDYASDNLNKKIKEKQALTQIRYITAVGIVCRVNTQRKAILENIGKLELEDEIALLQIMSETDQLAAIAKMLSGKTTREKAFVILENHPKWITHLLNRLLKLFEETDLTNKVKLGYLLLRYHALPSSKMDEYLRRISTYMQCSSHHAYRTLLYIELLEQQKTAYLPAIQRCKDRDSLVKDIRKSDIVKASQAIEYSLRQFNSLQDQVDDLIWLLRNHKNDLTISSSAQQIAYHSIMNAVYDRPENFKTMISSLGAETVWIYILAKVADILGSEQVGLVKSGELEQSIDNRYAVPLLSEWIRKQDLLANSLLTHARFSLSSLDFKQNYLKALTESWAYIKANLEKSLEQLLRNIAYHKAELEQSLSEFSFELGQDIEMAVNIFSQEMGNSLLDYTFEIYLQEINLRTKEVIQEYQAGLAEMVIPDLDYLTTPREFLAILEQTALFVDNVAGIYGTYKERIKYQIALRVGLTLEKIFLLVEDEPANIVQSLENNLIQLLSLIDSTWEETVGIPTTFDPSRHETNDKMEFGQKAAIVFPGLISQDLTLIRKALVKAVRE